jgi:PAS domain S-box-containing protein
MATDSAIDHAALIEQAADAFIFADRDGIVRVWNPGAERIFGYTPAAAIGQNLDIIVPEKFREAHWKGYDRALADGDTKYRGQSLPTRSHREDGTEIYVELSFAIVHGPGGVIGALAQARDITERFEQDRASRRRLRELEEALKAKEATA